MLFPFNPPKFLSFRPTTSSTLLNIERNEDGEEVSLRAFWETQAKENELEKGT